jgi:hypothetical protein
MKYQRLSAAELENLKDDFIRFLASQGIDAPLWNSMKKERLEDAEKIIEIYSDLVYDQALSKCEFLEYLTPKEFTCLHFNERQTFVVGVRVSENSSIDLTTSHFTVDLQKGLDSGEIQLFSASKKHEKLREQEMFDWITKGAYMADEIWFTQFQKMAEINS